jgi:hypothetical protein
MKPPTPKVVRLVVALAALAVLGCLATACHHGHGRDPARLGKDRPVTIEVEVYDPETNYVWENVGVRLVQAEQEWSSCICANPDRNDWYYTDEFGTVVFNPKRIANAEIGFKVDELGRAVISEHPAEDEAYVLIEVWAEGFTPVLREVKVTYKKNDVFLSIPFQ